MYQKKLSGGAKTFIAIFSFLSVIALFCEWIDGMSLLECSAALGGINAFADEPIMAFLSIIFSFGTILAAIFFIITAITAMSATTRKQIFNASSIVGFIIFGSFMILILISSNSFLSYFIDVTPIPFIFVFFCIMIEILSRSGTSIKQPAPAEVTTSNLYYCVFCNRQAPVGSTHCPYCGKFMASKQAHYSTKGSTLSKRSDAEHLLHNGGWECKSCGRVNPQYTGTCACGNTKYTN